MSLVGAAGVVMIVLAIPLLARIVPPNRLYGLRVAATFADRWVWYEANAKSARDMMIVGAVAAVLGLGVSGLPPVPESVQTAVLSAGLVVMLVVGWRRANRLLDERTQGGEPHD